jgi:hypothetical protein
MPFARSMERSLSPARAVTPTPMTARSLTPTTAAQQRGAEVQAHILRQARTSTGPLRASMPAAVCAANRCSTPVRSLTQPSLGGGPFSAYPFNQQGLAWNTLQQELREPLGADASSIVAGWAKGPSGASLSSS